MSHHNYSTATGKGEFEATPPESRQNLGRVAALNPLLLVLSQKTLTSSLTSPFHSFVLFSSCVSISYIYVCFDFFTITAANGASPASNTDEEDSQASSTTPETVSSTVSWPLPMTWNVMTDSNAKRPCPARHAMPCVPTRTGNFEQADTFMSTQNAASSVIPNLTFPILVVPSRFHSSIERVRLASSFYKRASRLDQHDPESLLSPFSEKVDQDHNGIALISKYNFARKTRLTLSVFNYYR